MKRRNFIKSAATACAGFMILPGCASKGIGANDKLNIALIGVYGRGLVYWEPLKNENVVALCDVNAENMALAASEFPSAKQYTDWRKCLEQNHCFTVFHYLCY